MSDLDHASAPPQDAARRGRRPGVRWVVGSVLLVLLVLVVWGGVAAATAYSAAQELQEARSDIAAAEAHLREVRLPESREALGNAVDRASDASDKLHRSYVASLRWVPVLGPNLEAATVLGDAARDASVAGVDLLDAAMAVVGQGPSTSSDEIVVAPFEELAAPTRTLAETLTRTTDEVESLPTEQLFGRLDAARGQYLELAGPAATQVALAADVFEVLPTFLGVDEPKTYLVGAAALSEIRGSGGLLGSWSVLTTQDGRMQFEDFVDVDELPQPEDDVASPSDDYHRRYARFDALRQYRNANLTPDFPAAAEVLIDLWEDGGGAPVDGVIVADTVVFQRLAERAGGLDLPTMGRLEPDETLRFVGVEAYDAFEDEDERKLVLGAVATSAFAEIVQVFEGDDMAATIEMLAAIADGGHLRIHTRDEAVQEVFQQAGLGGELPSRAGESAGVFANNIAGNKVDWFTSRVIEHHVRLLPDGVVRSTVEATFGNDAPVDGHSRTVLGPWTDQTEAGDNFALVTFTCSTSCAVVAAPDDSRDGGVEQGRPMIDSTVLLRPGETQTLRYQTESHDAWHFDGDDLVLDLEHLVQPTLHGTELTVRVDVPSDTVGVSWPEGVEEIDGQLVHTSRASGRVAQQYVFDGRELETSPPADQD